MAFSPAGLVFLLLLHLVRSDLCPDGTTAMAQLNYTVAGTNTPLSLQVCERLTSRNGELHFVCVQECENGIFPLQLQKRVANITAPDDDKYLNYTKKQVLEASTDILGAQILAEAAEPSLARVTAAIPPLRSFAPRIWVANRQSGRDATFDSKGSNWVAGMPSPTEASAVLPGLASASFDHEGLLGDDLPIVVLNFPTDANTSLWEMSIVPVANNTGFEQPIFIRFLQVNNSAAAGQSAPRVLYFDTFSYVPSKCASDVLAGCDAAANYYRAVLDNYFFWKQTWLDEGKMTLKLPERNDTNGHLLQMQAQHGLVLDMITRSGGVWPRYGTAPGYDQAGIGADGFQEIFTATMAASLEWGLHKYAKAVLENWLQFFVRADGGVLYRGLEMAQHGRMLTMIAQYYKYTSDSEPILSHLDKIEAVTNLLIKRRQSALLNYPLLNDSRHGMPTGNDEADLFWTTVTGRADTELPFISIATEMWRGFRDCSEVLTQLSKSHQSAQAAGIAEQMNAVSAPLLEQIELSMAIDAVGPAPRCFPYVAGIRECGMLPKAASNRDSEPWRTYSEALYSGALNESVISELVQWHNQKQGAGVRGSRLKLGVLAGAGGDVSSGDQLETFTIHGWGFGLLQADLIEPFLLQYYALSAHAYTRGTWIAPESTPIDRTKGSPPFATPAGLTAPLLLKWALVWEHPTTRTLWLGKATPRSWLSGKEQITVQRAPTAYGQVSYGVLSALDTKNTVDVNLTFTNLQPPPGGLAFRLRTPGRWEIVTVVLSNGETWPRFNVSEESIRITSVEMTNTTLMRLFQRFQVGFKPK